MRSSNLIGCTALLALAACDGRPDTTAPLLAAAQIAGDFEAEVAVFTGPGGAAVDVIERDGDFLLDLDGAGNFESTLVLPGQRVVTRGGTIRVVSDQLFIREVGGAVRAVPFVLEGRTLGFTDPGATFDFDGDGRDEAATFQVRLVPR